MCTFALTLGHAQQFGIGNMVSYNIFGLVTSVGLREEIQGAIGHLN